MNKDEVTWVSQPTICSLSLKLFHPYDKGGERTRDEMCFHMFTYYPRLSDLYSCVTVNDNSAWRDVMNTSS